MEKKFIKPIENQDLDSVLKKAELLNEKDFFSLISFEINQAYQEIASSFNLNLNENDKKLSYFILVGIRIRNISEKIINRIHDCFESKNKIDGFEELSLHSKIFSVKNALSDIGFENVFPFLKVNSKADNKLFINWLNNLRIIGNLSAHHDFISLSGNNKFDYKEIVKAIQKDNRVTREYSQLDETTLSKGVVYLYKIANVFLAQETVRDSEENGIDVLKKINVNSKLTYELDFIFNNSNDNLIEGINSKVYSLVEIFNLENTELHIPFFQRPYTWDKKMIDQLFRDIDKVYCYVQRTGDQENLLEILENKIIQRNLFLGNITLSYDHLAYTEEGKRIINIVDGQQRLTTILLLIHAIKKLAQEHKIDIEYFEKNTMIYNFKEAADNDAMKDIIQGVNLNSKDQYSVIWSNFNYLIEKIEKKNYSIKYLEETLNLIFVTINYIKVSDEIKSNALIFHSINNKNKKTQPFIEFLSRLTEIIDYKTEDEYNDIKNYINERLGFLLEPPINPTAAQYMNAEKRGISKEELFEKENRGININGEEVIYQSLYNIGEKWEISKFADLEESKRDFQDNMERLIYSLGYKEMNMDNFKQVIDNILILSYLQYTTRFWLVRNYHEQNNTLNLRFLGRLNSAISILKTNLKERLETLRKIMEEVNAKDEVRQTSERNKRILLRLFNELEHYNFINGVIQANENLNTEDNSLSMSEQTKKITLIICKLFVSTFELEKLIANNSLRKDSFPEHLSFLNYYHSGNRIYTDRFFLKHAKVNSIKLINKEFYSVSKNHDIVKYIIESDRFDEELDIWLKRAKGEVYIKLRDFYKTFPIIQLLTNSYFDFSNHLFREMKKNKKMKVDEIKEIIIDFIKQRFPSNEETNDK